MSINPFPPPDIIDEIYRQHLAQQPRVVLIHHQTGDETDITGFVRPFTHGPGFGPLPDFDATIERVSAPARPPTDANGLYAICPQCGYAIAYCRGHAPASPDDGAQASLDRRVREAQRR